MIKDKLKNLIKETFSLDALKGATSITINVSKEDIDEIVKELEESGPKYIDLGLPSGTLWADRNVGAARSDDYGKYFNFDDAQKQGTLPARWQFCELVDCCKRKICEQNGVKGVLFTGKNQNSIFMPFAGYLSGVSGSRCDVGNFGDWWSCTLRGNNAFSLYLYDGGYVDPSLGANRAYGHSVRLIKNK